MIKDPWPFNFEPFYGLGEKKYLLKPYCSYYRRGGLLCAAPREKCKTCYMKQQDLTDEQMLRDNNPVVEHYCDRCGRKIDLVDKIIYLHLEDREGRKLHNYELCGLCVSDLVDWVKMTKDEDEPEDV